MRQEQKLRVVYFVVSLFAAALVKGQSDRGLGWIDSINEPGEGLAIQHRSPQTGHVTFASSPGRGVVLPAAASASAEARALRFIEAYGLPFGLSASSEMQLMRVPQKDQLGLEHVRLQQAHRGVPIRGAEFLVHLKGSRVLAANGHTLTDLPSDVNPTLPASVAQQIASQVIAKYRGGVAGSASYLARLEILNRSLLSGEGTDRSRLAWFVEARGPMLRQYIWIDAHTGAVLLNFSQLTDAKNREVYTANHTATLPGTLLRSEGGAAVAGDVDTNSAYDLAGVTYDYFLMNHGRDSFDGAGATIVSTTHYCEDECPDFANAFWDGQQMVYGDTYASADDVVAHELTHAVTEFTAGLLYYVQSGALNESFSDIFGEIVDLTSAVGGGNDTSGVRWHLGEDLPIGAIRSMASPGLFGDPEKMSDGNFRCSTTAWTDPNSDSGGVHTNSGVPNHAFALMVDGGSYNGKTIAGIGAAKAAAIQYRALTVYLTSGSGFLDAYNAINQSCADLTGSAGITAADCAQVRNALEAVEMHLTWACPGAVTAPSLCTTGQPQLTSFEGFESGLGNWTAMNAGGSWFRIGDFAKEGSFSAYGENPGITSDHRLVMTSPVTIPSGARMTFDHAFEFENDGTYAYDGGVLEYSTDGGASWIDAATLIDGGQSYTGTVSAGYGNPLTGRPAFVFSSYGYVGTQLNLVTIAGQSAKFRFRIGSDSVISSLGWAIDNIAIYTCTAVAPFTDDPLVPGSTPMKAVHINELRARINALRIANGLEAFLFADSPLTASSTTIQAIHITQLRTALAEAYTAAEIEIPSYTDPGLTAAMTIKAIHISDLRAAVVALE